MTLIYYNNRQIVSGQPVPFVGRSEEMIRYGERWGVRSTLTLDGTLTGCNYAAILAAQSGLLRDFNQDFQTLEIVEDHGAVDFSLALMSGGLFQTMSDGEILFQASQSGGAKVVYSKQFAWVRSINFGESRYVGALGYSVTLECYEKDYFSGTFGVVEPSNDWVFDQQQDGKVNITHTIAARGFNTTSGQANAFDNAKAFVLANTGWRAQVYPAFITGSFTSPCLRSFGERPDRVNGSYSVSENYVYDPDADTCVILRYQSEYQCNTLDGRCTATVRGDVDGGMFTPMSGVRARYFQFNPFAAATDVAGNILNSGYVSSGVSEDINARKLTFEIVFDNIITSGNAWFDYSTSMEMGDGGLTKVALQGMVHGRGPLVSRYATAQAYFQTLNFFALASGQYALFNQTPAPLNPVPISSGNTYNQFLGEVGVNVTWDNRPIPSQTGLSEINFTYNVNDAVEQVGAIPLINGPCTPTQNYYLTDLGYRNRAEFSIEGNARPVCGRTTTQALADAKTAIEAIRLAEISGTNVVLVKHDFTMRNNSEGASVQFSCSWTFDPFKYATSPTGFSQIINLSVN